MILRRIMLLLISLLIPFFAFAGGTHEDYSRDLYFAPYLGSANINLNTPDWKEPISGTREDSSNRFAENRLVAIAALYGFSRDELKDNGYGMKITITGDSFDPSNNCFWMVSQSNPDSKRPFTLQMAGSIRYFPQAATTNGKLINLDYGCIGIDNDNTSYTWEYVGNGFSKKIYVSNNYLNRSAVNNSFYIICDFAMVLPGDIHNGILTYNNSQYVLAPASDYSASITIRVELIDSSGNLVSYTGSDNIDQAFPVNNYWEYSIPFSGFYDPLLRGSNSDEAPDEIGSSLSIEVLPGAGNIDLGNQSQVDIPIANINYSIYNLALTNANADLIDENVFIFLSANPNPRVGDSNGFRFVHEDVGINESPTPENSINYTIKAVSTEDTSSLPVIFDGTDYLEGDGLVHPGNQKLSTKHNEEVLSHAEQQRNRHWHTFVGQLQLSLVPNPRLIVPGYYDSYVYVHVIVDDSLEVMQ